MQFTATFLTVLSWLGIMAGIVISFWNMQFGAVAFLVSIACAHLAQVVRRDKHIADMQETLTVLMELCARTSEKVDALGIPSTTRPVSPPRSPQSQ